MRKLSFWKVKVLIWGSVAILLGGLEGALFFFFQKLKEQDQNLELEEKRILRKLSEKAHILRELPEKLKELLSLKERLSQETYDRQAVVAKVREVAQKHKIVLDQIILGPEQPFQEGQIVKSDVHVKVSCRQDQQIASFMRDVEELLPGKLVFEKLKIEKTSQKTFKGDVLWAWYFFRSAS